MIRRIAAIVVPALVVAAAVVAGPTHVSAAEYAPLDRPGPALSVPESVLAAAVICSGDFHANDLEPVLLNPATGVTAKENFSWNWEPAFTKEGRPWCAVTTPQHTLGDIQTAGEYIVYAIRHIHALAGRRVAVMGHSQGGMSMRWALRFWPDTRSMVDDVIGMAPDNHGTTLINPICVAGRTTCTPQGWQQRSTSAFIAALNSGAETFAGISYTEIYSLTDEVVLPTHGPTPSSGVFTGAGRIANVTTQSVCSKDVYEHLLIGTVDPVTYALAVDALNHDGPADPNRIDKAVCRQLYMPGVNPLSARNLNLLPGLPHVLLVPVPFANAAGVPQLKDEPALRCYVYANGCPN